MWKSRGGMGGKGPVEGMLRSARRIVRSGPNGVPDPKNTSSHSSAHTPNKRGQGRRLSSSATSQSPSSSTSTQLVHDDDDYGFWPFSTSCDEFEWVHGAGENESLDGFMDGPPSLHEAEDALLSLNQFVNSVSPSRGHDDDDAIPAVGAHSPELVPNRGAVIKRIRSVSSESDWDEPVMQIYDQRIIPRPRFGRVYDALHMIDTEPRVQKMVLSLSTDKAVWDAILSNEAVREFRESCKQEEDFVSVRSDDNSDDPPELSANVLTWMFDNARAKFMELINNITDLMNSLLPSATDPEGAEKYPSSDNNSTEKIRTAFMLTSIVLLIVIVTRAHRA